MSTTQKQFSLNRGASKKQCPISKVSALLGLLVLGVTAGNCRSAWVGQAQASAKFALQGAGIVPPLYFETNRGQAAAEVKFLARGPDGLLFLTQREVIFSGRGTEGVATLRMRLAHANAKPEVLGGGQLPGHANYYRGQDPSAWAVGVPTFAEVIYREVYPGIDLHFYGNDGRLEYDFIVKPGACPQSIELEVIGADSLQLADAGDLSLRIGSSTIFLSKPEIYQDASGLRKPIRGSYALRGKNRVSFEIANYDSTRTLIIDPVLVYSTYLGGSARDAGSFLLDTAGNVYMVGLTPSVDFPTTNAWQATYAGGNNDVFIAKVSPDGKLLFSTYFGGSGTEESGGTLDSVGNVYLCGGTSSTNLPALNAYRSNYGGGTNDVFLAKFNTNGVLQFSTYLGGNGWEKGGMHLDTNGTIYVSGETSSTNFPVQSAYQGSYGGGPRDVFVAKFNSSGAVQFSTYLGGSGDEDGNIIVDATSRINVIGWTTSTNFPVQSAARSIYGGGTNDLFVTKLNSTGNSVVYSTYFGGAGEEESTGSRADASGSIYLVGRTTSTNLPVANAVQTTYGGSKGANLVGLGDVFVTRFKPDGSLQFSTYLGGSGDESGSFDVDQSGLCVVHGWTTSTNFPLFNPAQAAYGGDLGNPMYSYGDVFVTKLNTNGQFVFSTYLGGRGEESGSLNMDASSNCFIVGMTSSTNFPVVSPVQAGFGGGGGSLYLGDMFVTKLNSAGGMVFSTYLGGNSTEQGWGYADADGNVLISGITDSTNYPTYNPAQAQRGGKQDAFVTKLNSGGQFVFSTYLGGTNSEQGYAYLWPGGGCYAFGTTLSGDFPVTNAVQSTYGGSNDVFLTKFDAVGKVVYSTFLGGNGNESGTVTPDAWGNVYVFGATTSTNFPVTNALQSIYRGQQDIFLVKISEGVSGCSYAISPSSVIVGAGTTNGTVSVTTSNTCAWTAVTNVSWLNITSGASGTNSGSVSYGVAANLGAARVGTIFIADKVFTVNQAAGAPTLTAWRSNSAVKISWPSSFTGFVLQESANMVINTWSNVSQSPVDDGSNETVTITSPSGRKFYRLKK
jgi:hypothetical protein